MAKSSSDPQVTSSLLSYTNFVMAKERAGKLRAVGAAAFGQGRFTEAGRMSFLNLVSEQKTYLQSFAAYAPPAIARFYGETLSGPSVDRFDQLETVRDQYAGGRAAR